MAAVTVRGLDELMRKLEAVGKPGALRKPMQQAVAHIHDAIAEYPPSSIANSPANGYAWYERGFGTKTRTGRSYPTSQTMGKRWTEDVSADGKRGVVGNNADYVEYVQSYEKQAAFHASRGWKTDADVAEAEADRVARYFSDAIDRL